VIECESDILLSGPIYPIKEELEPE